MAKLDQGKISKIVAITLVSLLFQLMLFRR